MSSKTGTNCKHKMGLLRKFMDFIFTIWYNQHKHYKIRSDSQEDKLWQQKK